MAAAITGANRASPRAIEPSDLWIAWTSLRTDIRRGLRKRASTADATDESYYAVAEARRKLGSSTRAHDVPMRRPKNRPRMDPEPVYRFSALS